MPDVKVLIIPSWYPDDKDPIAGIFIQQQALALKEVGVNIAVLSLTESFWHKKSPYLSIEDGLKVIRATSWLPPKRIKVLRSLVLKESDKLFRYYLQDHPMPNLLHAHSFVGGWVANYLSVKYHIPYIITEHYSGFMSGHVPRHWRNDLLTIYDNASKVIAVSEVLKKKLTDFTQNEISVIPNVIDTKLFHPSDGLIKSDQLELVTIGSLIDRKNHTFLLQMLPFLLTQIRARLTIIGEGPLLKELKQLAQKLKISRHICFKGNLPPNEVANILRQSHIFVFASKAETFGIALAEAVACGLHVISTPVGIAPELAKMEVGVIVNTKEEMAEAILTYSSGRKIHTPYQFHQIIRDRYGKEKVTGMLLQLYQNYTH
jgi:glycosyltransferase involved in cell wall biosynthesis